MNRPLPLFNWRERSEVERLRREREKLLARISRKRPHSHDRLALEERLRVMTVKAIELELALEREGRR